MLYLILLNLLNVQMKVLLVRGMVGPLLPWMFAAVEHWNDATVDDEIENYYVGA